MSGESGPESKVSTNTVNDKGSETVPQVPDENGWIAHVDPDTKQTYYIHSESGAISTSKLAADDNNAPKKEGKNLLTLIKAAEMGDLEGLQELIDNRADTTVADKDGYTALIMSAFNGQLYSVEMLLEAKADPAIAARDGCTALHVAAQNGDVEMVQKLLAAKAPADAKANDGVTPLLLAAQEGDNHTMRLLIDYGAGCNMTSNSGVTPLYCAAQDGLNATAELLIRSKADVNLPNILVPTKHGVKGSRAAIQRTSPLTAAVNNFHLEMVRLLIKNGADLSELPQGGDSPLFWCIKEGRNDLLKLLVQASGKEEGMSVVDDEGYTPLMCAAFDNDVEAIRILLPVSQVNFISSQDETALLLAIEEGHIESVQELLEGGASVLAQVGDGRTPLITAIGVHVVDEQRKTGSMGRAATFSQMLIDAGADVNTVDGQGNSPAMHAVFNESPECLQLLIGHGARLGVKNLKEQSPLDAAIAQRSVKCVEKLLTAMDLAQINEADENGSTALKKAVHQRLMRNSDDKALDVVNALIRKGALSNIADENGSTPLMFAVEDGDLPLCKILSMSADVRSKDKEGCTALHLAAQKRRVDITQWLCGTNASLNAKLTATGVTPLYLAARSGYHDIVEILVVAGADPDMPDAFGCTPLAVTAINGHTRVVDELLKSHKKVDVNYRLPDSQWTPLMLATQSGKLPMVKKLLDSKAEVNYEVVAEASFSKTDATGNSEADEAPKEENESAPQCYITNALSVAIQSGHNDIVELLKARGAVLPNAEAKEAAALALQKIYRGARVRTETKEQNAAEMLQSSFRGYSTRKGIQMHRQQVTVMQRTFRGFLARKHTENQERTKDVLKKIRERVKLLQAVQFSLSKRVKAATVLQAWARGNESRLFQQRRIAAVHRMQLFYRNSLVREQAKWSHNAMMSANFIWSQVQAYQRNCRCILEKKTFKNLGKLRWQAEKLLKDCKGVGKQHHRLIKSSLDGEKEHVLRESINRFNVIATDVVVVGVKLTNTAVGALVKKLRRSVSVLNFLQKANYLSRQLPPKLMKELDVLELKRLIQAAHDDIDTLLKEVGCQSITDKHLVSELAKKFTLELPTLLLRIQDVQFAIAQVLELCERVDKAVVDLNRRLEKGRKVRQFRKNKVRRLEREHRRFITMCRIWWKAGRYRRQVEEVQAERMLARTHAELSKSGVPETDWEDDANDLDPWTASREGVSKDQMIAILNKEHKKARNKGREFDVNARDPHTGEVIFFNTVWHGRLELARLMLEDYCCDPNKVDSSVTNCTPLIMAARSGNIEMTRLLLDNGAIRSHQDSSGDTALHWAARRAHRPVITMLLTYCGDEEMDAGIQSDIWSMLSCRNERGRLAYEVCKDQYPMDEIRRAYNQVPTMYRPRSIERPDTGELKLKTQLSFQAMKRRILIDAIAQHRFEQQQEEREKLLKDGLLEEQFNFDDLFV